MTISFVEIGKRLKAHRLGHQLTADTIAEQLDVSRAAVYRIENGDVVKIETLERLASILQTSVASLIGAGVEYYSSSVSYFERMRQIEERSEQVIAHFPPISYLLSSDVYPKYLKQTLLESLPTYITDRNISENEIDSLIAILNERKEARIRRHFSIVNFVNLPEIERWLKLGVVGRFDLPAEEVAMRRHAARTEVEYLIELIETQPMGIQIGLIEETLPNITFQLFRTAEGTLLGLSPYRLGGELPNIRVGVAMLTGDEQPVRLYQKLADDLWLHAHKGSEAARMLEAVLQRSGIGAPSVRKAS